MSFELDPKVLEEVGTCFIEEVEDCGSTNSTDSELSTIIAQVYAYFTKTPHIKTMITHQWFRQKQALVPATQLHVRASFTVYLNGVQFLSLAGSIQEGQPPIQFSTVINLHVQSQQNRQLPGRIAID